MRSIQKNLMLIIIFGIIAVAFIIGFISLASFTSIGKDRSNEILRKELEIRAGHIDNLCLEVEHAVQTMSNRLVEDMPEIDQFLQPEGIRYMEDAKIWAKSLVANNEKLAAVYYRLNPDIIDSKSGFFLSKNEKSDEILESEPTDLSLYDPTDREHVAWYYEPKETGKASWIPGYLNLNNGILTVSYVAPLYAKDGSFVGVVGLDIDMMKLYEDVSGIRIYDTGFAVLMSKKGEIQYSSQDVFLSDREKEEIISGKSSINSYIQQQRRMTLMSQQLVFGDYLLISIAEEELYINENRVIFSIVLAALSVSSLIIMFLTNLLNKMFYNFKTDPLTGAKNRSAYMDEIVEVDKHIQHGKKDFSVLVFDINGLKYINDNKGHAAGDEMIRDAVKEIRKFFPNENLYRIGGDEFVILFKNNRSSLNYSFCQFNREMQGMIKRSLAMEGQVTISAGMASFNCETDICYEDVLHRADQAMYAKKMDFYQENPGLARRKC